MANPVKRTTAPLNSIIIVIYYRFIICKIQRGKYCTGQAKAQTITVYNNLTSCLGVLVAKYAGAGLFPQVSQPDAFECSFDGLWVDMPHESSDVLNLPAPGAMAPYFTCEFDGRQKLIRQLHGLKLAERQGDAEVGRRISRNGEL